MPNLLYAAEDYCDGKYDKARDMLDAVYGKYGTLFAGGNFFSHRDNIGATLDLYRLWRGLPDLHAWLNVGRTYVAGSVGELADIHATHNLDGKTMRALNLLSTDDLLIFARADGRLEEDRRMMVKTAFARYFTPGRYADAAALLPDLKTLYPDSETALDAIMARSFELKVRLTLAIQELPDPSVWMIGSGSSYFRGAHLRYQAPNLRRMNFPGSFQTASFLQRDLEVWTKVLTHG